MIVEATLLFCCLFSTWLFYTHYYKPYYVVRKSLQLPGPQPSLFYGNYSEIARLGYLECMSKWTSQYGATFVYYLGITPQVVTSDVEIIKSIMVKNFDDFVNRPPMPLLLKEEDEITELPLLRDDRWRRVRRILVPMFTSKRLKTMAPLIEERCERLRSRMAAEATDSNSLEVWRLFGSYTLGVILATGFGRDIGDDNPLAKSAACIAEQLSSGSGGASFKWLQTILSHFPWAEPFIKYFVRRSAIAKNFDYLERVALKLIEDRREATGKKTQDLLQMMLEAYDDSNEGTKSKGYLTNGEIVGSMVEIIMASYDTVRGALSYAAYQLALNPSIQDELIKEINEYYNANPDSSLYDAAENIEYVNMVLHESMRMFSTAPDTNRECSKTCTINGIVLQEGVAINIPFACVHQNPEYWPNPSTFDPERFRDPSYPKFAYLPFGEGPRHCIGKRLGLLVLKMTLITILKEFQFRKTTKTEVPLQLTTDLFSNPKHGIHLSIIKTPAC